MTKIELFALAAASTLLVVSIKSTLDKLFTGLCGAIRGLPQKRKYFVTEILLGSLALSFIIYIVIAK